MPFPLIPLVTALAPTLIEKIVGKKKAQAIEGVVKPILESKGLLRSKTAQFASGALVGKLLALWVLPLPQRALWVLSAVILAEWGASILLRLKTKEAV